MIAICASSSAFWRRLRRAVAVGGAGISAGAALAQDFPDGLNTYAMPGLVEMPSTGALALDDLAYSLTVFRNTIRHAASFQLTERLTVGLRYNLSYLLDADGTDFAVEDNFDRSLGLHYRLVDEGTYWPGIAVGVNDILGTGRFESEYIVATKTLVDGFSVTAGLGWGRLASAGGIASPFASLADREALVENNTIGEFNEIQWFRGDVAVFGGVTWQATPDLRLAFEVSSDAYPLEDGRAFDVRSPYNVALQYAVSDRATLGLAWLYSSELAVQFSYQLNPGAPRDPSGLEPAGPLVQPRPARIGADAVVDLRTVRLSSAQMLDRQGINLHRLVIGSRGARVEIENRDWQRSAQALGRAARVLTATLPPQVERFEIVLIEDGLPVSATTIGRSDLETYEFAFDGAQAVLAGAEIVDAGPGTQALDGLYPRFTHGFAPYLAPSLFDPDGPLRADAGVDLFAAWEPAPGLAFSGVLRQPIVGNLDDTTRASTSILPRVRSEAYLYDKAGTALTRLTAAYNFRPAPDIYRRVQAGLLEPMFGGVAAEVLWVPAGARVAFGAEVAHVVQRDFDQMFGFQDYAVTTGHLSAYWDMGAGFESQIDVGRYLAGDYGATVTISRRFQNGWTLGAFATLTDVPFDDFGEGSFDKGIVLSVPLNWVTRQPTRETSDFVLRPVLRDGGARLNLDGRLYETVRGATGAELAAGWDTFWR